MQTSIGIAGLHVGPSIFEGALLRVFNASRNDGEDACVLLVSPSGNRPFLSRCRALALVRHPSIASIYQIGSEGDFDFAVAAPHAQMLLGGRRPLPPPAFHRLALELAGAVAELHRAGLTHGAITAENIRVDSNGGVELLCHDILASRRWGRGLSPALADLHALRDLLRAVAPRTPQTGAIADLFADRIGGVTQLYESLSGTVTPRRRSDLPTTGREVEFDVIRTMWSQTQESGGRLLWLQGTAGSGKTHLLERTVGWATQQGSTAFYASAQSADNRPLAGLRQLLGGFFRRLAERPAEEQARLHGKLRAVLAGLPAEVLVGVCPAIADFVPPALTHEGRMGALLTDIASEFILRLSDSERPLVIAIDDIGRLDGRSLDVLLQVAEETAGHNLFFIFSSGKKASAGQKRLHRLLNRTPTERLVLRPLDDASIADLVRTYLRVDSIDLSLATKLGRLSDRTPMSVLEVLRAVIDQGLLAPYWGSWHLDEEALRQANLPCRTHDILSRRRDGLAVRTKRFMQAAAVIGTEFSRQELLQVTDDCEAGADATLEDAASAELIEHLGNDRFRFVHHNTREAFLDTLSRDERRAHHQNIATALDQAILSGQLLQVVAMHYAQGVVCQAVERRLEVCQRAAMDACDALDDTRARFLFEAAQSAGLQLGQYLDVAALDALGELHRRAGNLEESESSFRAALRGTQDLGERARLWGRIGWIHLTTNHLRKSYAAHARALSVLGITPPRNSILSLLGALPRAAWQWSRAWLSRGSSSDVELISTICHQMMRAAVESEEPWIMLQAVLIGLPAARHIGPSPTLARFTAVLGFVQMISGMRRLGQAKVAKATTMAQEVGDMPAQVYCLQVESMLASWQGHLDPAIEKFRRCHRQFGQWQDISEYSHVAISESFLHSIRGHNREAWLPLARALRRAKHQASSPAATRMVYRCARSVLLTLGQQEEALRLNRSAPLLRPEPSPDEGVLRLVSWTCAVRELVAAGNLGSAFEELTHQFAQANYNPRTVHPLVVEYYVVVAYARMAQVFSGSTQEERLRLLEKLRQAEAELRLAARAPVMKAHALVVRGGLAWFDNEESEPHLCQAELLAQQENAPWVLHEAGYCRARILRQQGHLAASADQALMATAIAERHGCRAQVRRIAEDFQVTEHPQSDAPPQPVLVDDSRDRVRRHLRALLHISQAVVDPTLRADVVLDELIHGANVERGLLLTCDSGVRLAAARTDQRQTFNPRPGVLARLLDRARRGRHSKREPDDSVDLDIHTFQYTMTVPLLLADSFVGVLYLERQIDLGAFDSDDLEIIQAIANQLPVALELARVSKEREGLQTHLRQANKMEAIGQLAGGIAHDFNNMLTVIIASTDGLQADPQVCADPVNAESLKDIHEATQRAATMTRQLLSFSQLHPAAAEPQSMQKVVEGLMPLLRRLISEDITIDLECPSELGLVNADSTQVEQVVVNLVVNARDAMPTGGTLQIRCYDEVVSQQVFLEHHDNVQPGTYVVFSVVDTGEGMVESTRERLFEPFFTTKAIGKGTGMGLATVYGIVSSNGGHIRVDSTLGQGSSFRVYWPRVEGVVHATVVEKQTLRLAPRGKAQLLIVEDEELIRKALGRALRGLGYAVLEAENGRRALQIVEAKDDIDLILTDVRMPEMSGPELVRAVAARRPKVRSLYMSGYTDGLLGQFGIDESSVGLLRKPFSSDTLAVKIRAALDD